jgi:hypothetical protein
VKKLCEAQEKLFSDHFKKGSGLDYECIQTCFEMFANGELRNPGGPGFGKPGEPDGAFLFLFAEFATVAIEEGCDTDIWTNLLRVFVKVQEIFIQVYPPTKGPGHPFDRPRPYKGPPVGEAEKTRLRNKYKGKTKDELIDEYKKNLDKANGQKEVAIRFGGPLEEFAFAAVDSHLRDIANLADVVIREAALPHVEAARWEALAAASASVRRMFLLSFHPAPGIQGFLGMVTIDVPVPGSSEPEALELTTDRLAGEFVRVGAEIASDAESPASEECGPPKVTVSSSSNPNQDRRAAAEEANKFAREAAQAACHGRCPDRQSCKYLEESINTTISPVTPATNPPSYIASATTSGKCQCE